MRWYLGPYQIALLAIAAWMTALSQVAEGQQQTLGAYHRPWK